MKELSSLPIENLIERAKAGDGQAAFELYGYYFKNGEGEEANYWLKESAEKSGYVGSYIQYALVFREMYPEMSSKLLIEFIRHERNSRDVGLAYYLLSNIPNGESSKLCFRGNCKFESVLMGYSPAINGLLLSIDSKDFMALYLMSTISSTLTKEGTILDNRVREKQKKSGEELPPEVRLVLDQTAEEIQGLIQKKVDISTSIDILKDALK
ncbi:hypothetical protein [Teredinibacter sp. KSP-S5-2]|uniref:hypothetical protein n=1 Tax=Teredinibacter sp. KSP-S5-2 TaxID=3034506 RepID=UPI002934613C|nr:hypothetical protein [Teredinibacter sp. KSP-S5-2]WNO08312.1 hypothetical protein P5V12_15175 [Teredinibacter sp. KSP-S5-2]